MCYVAFLHCIIVLMSTFGVVAPCCSFMCIDM